MYALQEDTTPVGNSKLCETKTVGHSEQVFWFLKDGLAVLVKGKLQIVFKEGFEAIVSFSFDCSVGQVRATRR